MDVDALADAFSDTKVDPTALGQHPHFAHYKNATRAADQQATRRSEALKRQQERRSNAHNRLRKMADNEDISDEELGEEEAKGSEEQTEAMDLSTKKKERKGPGEKRKNRYADQLMLSEWLVDIPEELSSEWIMLPSPVGRRVLVVASKGVTSVYNKGGRLLHQFQSALPSRGASRFTILDCILSGTVFYCIDLLAYNGTVRYDEPFNLRRFFLNSHLTDNEELGKPSKKCKFTFKMLPECLCDKGQMERMLNADFEFDVDGFLFYYSEVRYESGQSPLVGWLKPFMLQEILGIQVPDKFLEANKWKQSSHEFITDFNKKHKHTSKIQKDAEMAE